MCVITEEEIRKRVNDLIKAGKKEITIRPNDILTPSAKSYLTEKNIQIIKVPDVSDSEGVQEVYETLFGATLTRKPEHMTHLRGNTLVFKDHPRIAFRGKIDSLEAEIINVQILVQKHGLSQMLKDLQEVIIFIRQLIRCEVSGERIDTFDLQGLTPKELREQSHHPSQYFGMKHVLPHYSMGEIVVALNKLRTLTRETELIAYNAFKNQYGEVERNDIIKALNRLSSLFWIMMFKYMTNRYKES